MMKKNCLFTIVLSAVLVAASIAYAADITLNESQLENPVAVEGKKNLFKSGCFYFGGQPNLETLRWLQSEGVNVVINLRSENENKDFAENSFNEESWVKELGMSYYSLPVGDKDCYCPATVEKFAGILKANSGKALIHCLSAGRVTYLWMAYLVRYRNYSLNDAIDVGKKLKYSFVLEDYLGSKIIMNEEKKE
jgi:protein tyrosine phosphatase (PTP) superfamily phosphohydrolase (DUF442 family)